MSKRFHIISKDGKYYLADKKTDTRQEMVQESIGGKIAWVSTKNLRALIPNDQVMGYFAMSEYEFAKLAEGDDALWGRDDFACLDARIVNPI